MPAYGARPIRIAPLATDAPARPWRSDRRVESGLASLGSRVDRLGVLHHGGRSFNELHGAVPVTRAGRTGR